MKRVKRSRLIAVSALCSTCLLVAGSAFAFQTFSGALCQPRYSNGNAFAGVPLPQFFSTFTGTTNLDTANNSLTCATSVTSIGTANVAWQVGVTETSATKSISCQGFVTDSFGNIIASTPIQSTGNIFTGTTTLSLSNTLGGFATTRALSVLCDFPSQGVIHSLSVL
jgi:hypothetical protein